MFDYLVSGDPTPSTDRHEIRSPATDEYLAVIPQHGRSDVGRAFGQARVAQPRWAATPLAQRRAILARFLDTLYRQRDGLLDVLQLEGGKARIDALSDLGEAMLGGSYHIRTAHRVLAGRRRVGVIPGLTSVAEIRQPVGVVTVIAPWNAPIGIGIGDSVPALLAGNAVILKPDNQTALSTLYAHRVALAAGLPPGVFHIVLGTPAEVGDTLIGRADYVAFTGSTATGRRVATRAAERLIGCSLELGGKNPMIVLPTADLDRVAAALPRASFANAGQICLTAERLYVHESVYDKLLGKITDATRAIRLGHTMDFSTDVGSLTTQAGLDKTIHYIDDALGAGAALLTGGRPRPDIGPRFHEPTILTGVTADCAVHTEEVFGPIVSVYRFDTDDEAVDLANASDYGLSASLWSKDIAHARELAYRIQCGAVTINDAYTAAFASHAATSGGMKTSGIGRRHGSEGILRFTEQQSIAVQRFVSPDSTLGLPRTIHGAVLGAGIGALRKIPR